ncbi:CRP-like cAMP-binding protein [Novosphingobium fluoreni]|uniref:CRP-like cAMP-binding protein n=1 Tax=Novosphingobium fluoreni TaxID=1391222 RepID=A0A7W6C102_9SPHN|nr:Crp/Fnr family transcriptional regulator [Novosphingobium fluoreni]MBB3941498.1 CRP-like cAMP-binding protein [Novosphingobium fluoreni]
MSDPLPTVRMSQRQNEGCGIEQGSVGNGLLRVLRPEDFAALSPFLQRVPLELGSTLARAGERIDEICFPEAAVIGLIDVLESEQRLAIALSGREGFVGWPLVLGSDRWPHEAVVRAKQGTALKIRAVDLLAILDTHPLIRTVLLRYAMTLMTQMTRTIVSNLIHPVDRRTARWLLLYHDRIDGDEIAITHEELGLMLGVRRSTITDALHQLEGSGVLRGYRGRLMICDRGQLEALAGETYGFAEREYARLLISNPLQSERPFP